MNDDFRDLLHALLRAGDVWVRPDPPNAGRVWQALLEFGAPAGALGVSREDLETRGIVVQIGLPPRRLDILTEVSGLD